MKDDKPLSAFLDSVKSALQSSKSSPEISQVSINIVPGFILQVKVSKLKQTFYNRLKIQGTLFYQNGQLTILPALYKDNFFNRLNRKQTSRGTKYGTFIYDIQTLGIKYESKISSFAETNQVFLITKPIFQHIKGLSSDLRSALELVGLTRSNSKNNVQMCSIKRKYQRKILDVIYGKQPQKQLHVQNWCESPITEVYQIKDLDQQKTEACTEDLQKIRESKNLDKQDDEAKNIKKGGYCEISRRILQFKVSQNDNYLCRRQVAVKNMKKNRQNGENKIDNEQRILRKIKNNKYLVDYFKFQGKKQVNFMEFVDFTLSEYIYNKPYMTIAQVMKLCFQLLQSVLILHHYGVIHRDIKPSNFLIKNTESGIKLKVIDFGESTLKSDQYFEQDLKKLGCTLPYSPIECVTQSQEGFNNFQIDYWSIGIIIYQILYKKIPVSYSRCFGQDIAKGWMRDFSMPIRKTQKIGIRFIENIFNIICLKMMKVKQNERMNLNKALAIMEYAKAYLEQINSI